MTAEEFMRAFNTDEELSFDKLHGCDATEDTLKIMVEFAKYHVEKALMAVHNEIQLPDEDLEFTQGAYPLENIK